jgi:hypothetical protein
MLLGLLLTATASAEEGIPKPEFDGDVLQQLTDWRNDIRSLRVSYKWGSVSAPLGDNQTPPQHSQSQWLWADRWVEGPRALVQLRTRQIQEGRPVKENWEGHNSYIHFWAEFAGGSGSPTWLRAHSLKNVSAPSFPECHALAGLFHPSLGWYSDFFSQFSGAPAGTREFDGVQCVGIQLQHFPQRWIMWLDPARNGLPRALECIGSDGAVWAWRCTHFQRMASGLWFPRRGTFGMTSVPPNWFEIEAVEVNPSLSSAAFDPPRPSYFTSLRDDTEGWLTEHWRSRRGGGLRGAGLIGDWNWIAALSGGAFLRARRRRGGRWRFCIRAATRGSVPS